MSEKAILVKEYTNGEVTIVWKPRLCFHSAKCVHGLPGVFDAQKRPWIDPEGADTQQIIDQVNQCPSGALSYYLNAEGKPKNVDLTDASKVEVMKDGPLLVHGNIQINHSDGSSSTREKITAFCRCGASGDKPFCDGSHKKVGFEG